MLAASTPRVKTTAGRNIHVEKVEISFEDNVRMSGRFKLKLFLWIRIDELKKLLARLRYEDGQNWESLRLYAKNIELSNNSKRFLDYNVDIENTIIIKKRIKHNLENGVIISYQIFQKTPPQISKLIASVENGLAQKRKPKLAIEGTSGTYFLENKTGEKVAIYKPFDEQPFTPNNPRGLTGKLWSPGMRKGILSGECATRQVAAYLIDCQENFHEVPYTTYVQFYHPSFHYNEVVQNELISSSKGGDLGTLKTKHGSLQQFVVSNDVIGNMGAHQFSVDQIHKIAILDIRILNCDRNDANVLVKKIARVEKESQKKVSVNFKLIPIDHGLSLPDRLEIYDYQIIWMSFSQAKSPFSEKFLKFISNIDPARDAQTLRERLGFRQICLRNFRIAQMFIKAAAELGFNAFEMGSMLYRSGDDSSDDDDDDEDDDDDFEPNGSPKRDSKGSKGQKKKNKEYSEVEKLVSQAENIYFLVKQNGIKSAVEFQLGLVRDRREHQLTFPEQKHLHVVSETHNSEESEGSSQSYSNESLSMQREASATVSVVGSINASIEPINSNIYALGSFGKTNSLVSPTVNIGGSFKVLSSSPNNESRPFKETQIQSRVPNNLTDAIDDAVLMSLKKITSKREKTQLVKKNSKEELLVPSPLPIQILTPQSKISNISPKNQGTKAKSPLTVPHRNQKTVIHPPAEFKQTSIEKMSRNDNGSRSPMRLRRKISLPHLQKHVDVRQRNKKKGNNTKRNTKDQREKSSQSYCVPPNSCSVSIDSNGVAMAANGVQTGNSHNGEHPQNHANRQRHHPKTTSYSRTEKWQQIFYHYFEDLLNRFLVEKKKQKEKQKQLESMKGKARPRLMSEDIRLGFDP